MTTSSITVMHCDFAGCDAMAPDDTEGKRYVQQHDNGWTDAIYTHGCPAHGEAILAHAATITYQTRGRGRSERTTWFLKCACGWDPKFQQTDTSQGLKKAHLVHLAQETAA